MKKILILLFFALITVSVARAQAPDPDTTAKHFIIMASIGNLQEISSGQLAAQKAQRANVRSFAKMMVDDHSQAQRQLTNLWTTKHYNIPAEATSGIQTDLKLKNAAPDAFDRLYIHAMATDHRSTVQMFQEYAINGKDPDVKAFAQKTLPTLKAHLEEVKALDAQIKDVAR